MLANVSARGLIAGFYGCDNTFTSEWFSLSKSLLGSHTHRGRVIEASLSAYLVRRLLTLASLGARYFLIGKLTTCIRLWWSHLQRPINFLFDLHICPWIYLSTELGWWLYACNVSMHASMVVYCQVIINCLVWSEHTQSWDCSHVLWCNSFNQ